MNYRAKKRFGQNFLKDQTYLRQIIEAIPATQSQMIEIGIGLGDLTDELLKLHNLIAYEVDRDLCSLLSDRHQMTIEKGCLKLICCDVMGLENQYAWLHAEPYFLISNLPYYIATHIVLRLLRDPMCEGLVVMTQKEVAHKFCAQVFDKEFCALSVIAQSVGKIDYLFDVPPSAFEPAPKVTSAVFRIIKSPQHPTLDELASLERLLKTAFAAPRKKLSKNLLHLYPAHKIREAFHALNLEDNSRPHEVSTSLYHQFLKLL
ncbi:16S rRNA (adenine(1518)-N(6)/adenine(1519)-N(6))-dimethyltransferase RsmA [Helicobacter pametensis]|uniref:16S rRNA (adenine(1518)-N(6)/adenine(1519)-N(6))- dimethyltransferase RsmA n=1 Tax=Helicobacter pametensis TaxID=95149 RepID=UPI0004813827